MTVGEWLVGTVSFCIKTIRMLLASRMPDLSIPLGLRTALLVVQRLGLAQGAFLRPAVAVTFSGSMAATQQGTVHPKIHSHRFDTITHCSLSCWRRERPCRYWLDWQCPGCWHCGAYSQGVEDANGLVERECWPPE